VASSDQLESSPLLRGIQVNPIRNSTLRRACGSVVLVVGSFCCSSTLPAQQVSSQAAYTLKPTPKTVAWGYYDAKAAPVLRVKSGDTIEIPAPVASTTAQDEKRPIIYVKHLVPPRGYPPLARQTRVSGTIVMKLKIAPNGMVLAVESEPSHAANKVLAMLRDDAEKTVNKWTFGCVGCPPDLSFEHTIRFNYRLDYEDVLPDNWVTMDLPDEVTISASPPMVNPGGATPKTSKKESN